MNRELSNKYIYDDFIYKTKLTELEKQVLDMVLQKETIIAISLKCNISERNVSHIIRSIKDKYNDYKNLELAKLQTFMATKK